MRALNKNPGIPEMNGMVTAMIESLKEKNDWLLEGAYRGYIDPPYRRYQPDKRNGPVWQQASLAQDGDL